MTPILLYQSLKEQFHIADCRLLSPEQPLARPFFCEEGRAPAGNHIYLTDRISDLTDVRSAPEQAVFVVCQEEASAVLPEGRFSAILLSCRASLSHVFNCIQSVFDHYENWESGLNSVCRREGSLEELLEASRPVFRNPLCIMGADWLPAASAGISELPKLQSILEDSALRVRYMNAFNQDPACQLPPLQRTPALFPDHITGHRSLNMNLFVDGQAEYRLTVIENGSPLTDADRYLITVLARYAEYILQRMHSESFSRNTALQSAFQTILTDRAADYAEIGKLLSAVGWLPEHRYFCAVIQASAAGHAALNPRAACRYIQDTFPASCSVVFQDRTVSFFNLTLSGTDQEGVCGKLVYFIRDSILRAGYSRTLEGHRHLYHQYLQALTALQLGSELHPQLWIHQFNQVALPYILREAVGTFPASLLCCEGLLKLQETDRQQGTEYMKTLKVYLDHNLNTVQSARSLYIHRSTFLYRLERIKRILETDLEDPEELFYLNLSFRLPEKP